MILRRWAVQMCDNYTIINLEMQESTNIKWSRQHINVFLGYVKEQEEIYFLGCSYCPPWLKLFTQALDPWDDEDEGDDGVRREACWLERRMGDML